MEERRVCEEGERERDTESQMEKRESVRVCEGGKRERGM